MFAHGYGTGVLSRVLFRPGRRIVWQWGLITREESVQAFQYYVRYPWLRDRRNGGTRFAVGDERDRQKLSSLNCQSREKGGVLSVTG
jgi:hypothetical protein